MACEAKERVGRLEGDLVTPMGQGLDMQVSVVGVFFLFLFLLKGEC